MPPRAPRIAPTSFAASFRRVVRLPSSFGAATITDTIVRTSTFRTSRACPMPSMSTRVLPERCGPVRRSYGCRNNVRGPSRRRRSLVCRRSTTASLSYEISRRHGNGSVNSTHFGGSRTGSAAIGNKGAESACGSSGGPVLGGAGEREPHGADEAAAAEVGPAAVGERAAVGLEE